MKAEESSRQKREVMEWLLTYYYKACFLIRKTRNILKKNMILTVTRLIIFCRNPEHRLDLV